MNFGILLVILILASPFIIYLMIVFRILWEYFRIKDKTRKKAILHTFFLTYDFGLFTLLVLSPLTILFPSSSSSDFRLFRDTLGDLFYIGAIWYVTRTVLGIIYWLQYRATKNAQKKIILQKKMNWGFMGILLFILVFIFYYVLTIFLSLFTYSSSNLQLAS